MPAASVHCCVTSPPYWGLRDYGTPPQLWDGDPQCRHRWGDDGKSAQRLRNGIGATTPEGARIAQGAAVLHPSTGAFCQRCGAWRGSLDLEPDYRLYIDHLLAVLREVRRVLRPDGSLWLNLGDCYATGAGKAKRAGGGAQGENPQGVPITLPNRMPQPGLKAKDLAGIPWRVAFALQDDGWWLRRDVVWSKPNPMPESVRERPTTAHEYLFLLTKSARYYYDGAAIKEPAVDGERYHGAYDKRPAAAGRHERNGRCDLDNATAVRNKRSGCPAGGTVLDPFLGAGTTALVADRLGRHCLGIELSQAYALMARQRTAAPAIRGSEQRGNARLLHQRPLAQPARGGIAP